MSKQEYEEFLRMLERVRAERTNNCEEARKLLEEEGLLTEDGELTAPYRPVA